MEECKVQNTKPVARYAENQISNDGKRRWIVGYVTGRIDPLMPRQMFGGTIVLCFVDR